jgi:hypothetical protein
MSGGKVALEIVADEFWAEFCGRLFVKMLLIVDTGIEGFILDLDDPSYLFNRDSLDS